jgi:hypothetical protein
MKKKELICACPGVVKVEFDRETGYIWWTPVGDMPHALWAASFEAGFKFLGRNGEIVKGWINDTRKLKTVKTESIDWLADLCINLCVLTAPPPIVFIAPEDEVGKVSVMCYLYQSAQKNWSLRHALVDTPAEAEKWLKDND